MRKTLLALALATTSLPARAADWMDGATRPAFGAAEAVTDRVYGLLRGHLFSSLLPGRLSSRMSAAPVGSSYALFSAELHRKQARATRRIVEARPASHTSSPAALAAWRDQTLREQRKALTDAFADSLVGRYQLERFGRDSGDYAADSRNWDPGFIASASVLGGAYLYVAGLRSDWAMGPVRVDLDTATGAALRGAIENGSADGLATLTISRRGSPLALRTDWGARSGRAVNKRVALNYTARF